ncbi:serine/threonine-protein kinase [Haliangium ochraceum]|uniref:Serine/threonine protein kinase n=1 Tax=Haliangium ochraceum (strain DSM 14365 / JCM 11303 / SMP-2) TaxID=502025 RepID=D0LTM1_HALO1|nr:serine/threonine-protein kinase [Haliangium ochraceum]ACY15715.1 serine/threonine protein kinase [Haliangium ochraceum DSM 14365]
MSDSQESIRPRTSARLRFVAPPGMKVAATGDRSIGRYEIVQTLGKGAMGVVYQARDPALDRTVAIKTIVAPRSGKRVHTAYLERFQREAQAAAKMQHPSIVTIFDFGIEEGAPYMVLEYLPGESLADRLDQVRMRLGKAIQIGLDLASALAFAHRQRIVHRDVKPANVLHAGENRWKLADFGIARMPDSDLTQVGVFMGTPGYSPPEAIKFGHYTPQADIFAWGAVLYEMLSGRIPYEGPDTRTTNGYVIKATAPSPRTYDPTIPEPLAEVVMRALDPSVSDRYKDGAAAEKALREAWDMCLISNMIPGSCLAGEDLPHDRVQGEMHTGTVVKAPGAEAATPSAAPQNEADSRPVLVIESSQGRISDDAPTRVLVRDGDDVRIMANPAGAGAEPVPAPSAQMPAAQPAAQPSRGSAPVAAANPSQMHPAAAPPHAGADARSEPMNALSRESMAMPAAEGDFARNAQGARTTNMRVFLWAGIAVMIIVMVGVLVTLINR